MVFKKFQKYLVILHNQLQAFTDQLVLKTIVLYSNQFPLLHMNHVKNLRSVSHTSFTRLVSLSTNFPLIKVMFSKLYMSSTLIIILVHICGL